MAAITEPKLISGNANLTLAKSIARRMSMHRGMSVNLVDARVERFHRHGSTFACHLSTCQRCRIVAATHKFTTEHVYARRP